MTGTTDLNAGQDAAQEDKRIWSKPQITVMRAAATEGLKFTDADELSITLNQPGGPVFANPS